MWQQRGACWEDMSTQSGLRSVVTLLINEYNWKEILYENILNKHLCSRGH